MSKRGRKKKVTQNRNIEMFELGTSSGHTSSSRSISQRVQTLESLVVDEKEKKKILDSFDSSEELVSSILDLWYQQNIDKKERDQIVAAKVVGLLHYLGTKPIQPDMYVYSSLVYLSHLVPAIFGIKVIYIACAKFLQRDPRIGDQNETNFVPQQTPFRINPALPLLCCSLLYNYYKNILEWPLVFIQSYMEDAFGGRVWVDAEVTRLFTLNILTCLPLPYYIPKGTSLSKVVSHAAGIEPSKVQETDLMQNRWPEYQRERIDNFVVQMVLYHEPSRSDNLVNFIKTLCTVVSVPGTRYRCVPFLEEWLSDMFVSRYAKDYFIKVAKETSGSDKEDLKIVETLVKMKGQQALTQYISILCSNNPMYPKFALRIFLENDFRTIQPNFKLLGALLKSIPEKAEYAMAAVFQELAMAEENRLPLFNFIKRLYKLPSNNRELVPVDFVALACGMLQEFPIIFKEDNASKREIWITIISDIVLLIMLLIAPIPSPGLRSSLPKQISDFSPHMSISTIQRSITKWWSSMVTKIIIPYALLGKLLRKLLFMESADSYASISDESSFQSASQEMPIQEETLFYLLHTPKLPSIFPPTALLEILSILVYRAAHLQNRHQVYDKMQINNTNIVEDILRVTIACTGEPNAPSSQWAYSELYWKLCILLLIIASYNCKSIGDYIWRQNRTIKQMLEMCVTQRFINSPVEIDGTSERNEIRREVEKYKKQQNNEMGDILQKLAAFSIKREHIMLVPSKECPCEIPKVIIEQVERMNRTFKLGKLLCATRSPDFLVDVMQRQGAKVAVTWLLPIVKEDSSALSNLPVTALIHILLSYLHTDLTRPPMEFILLLKECDKYLKAPDPQASAELMELLLDNLSTENASTIKRAANILCTDVPLFSVHNIEASSTSMGKHRGRNTPKFASPRFSPVDTHTDRKASISNLLDAKSLEKLQILQSRSSYEWLPALRQLSHFEACRGLIFHKLKAALFYEECEKEFSLLLTFLEAEVLVQVLWKEELALVLGTLLSTRPIIVERLFRNSSIFSCSLRILAESLENVAAQGISSFPTTLPDHQIIMKCGQKEPFIIHKYIATGIINLLGLVGRFEGELTFSAETSARLHSTIQLLTQHNEMALFYDFQKKKYLCMLQEENTALNLMHSSSPALFLLAITHIPLHDLIRMISHFGISSSCMEALFTRMDAEKEKSKLSFLAFPADLRRTILCRIRLYESMSFTKASVLLSWLDARDVQLPVDFSSVVMPSCEPMDLVSCDKTIPYIFPKTKKDIICLVELYFLPETSSADRDLFLARLLSFSRSTQKNRNTYDVCPLEILLQFFHSMVEGEWLAFIFRSHLPLLMAFLDTMILSIQYLDKNKLIRYKEVVFRAIQEKVRKEFPSHRKTSIAAFLRFLMGQKHVTMESTDDIISNFTNSSSLAKLVRKEMNERLESLLRSHLLQHRLSFFPILIDTLMLLPPYHIASGILLDLIETCYAVTKQENGSAAWQEHFFRHIFSYNDNTKGEHRCGSRMLVGMVLHCSNWRDMETCCDWIYSASAPSILNYSHAIDYQKAYVYHPRSWNGYTCTGEAIATLYKFTPEKIIQLIDLLHHEQSILKEEHSINDRMKFLLSVLKQHEENIYFVLLHVLNLCSSTTLHSCPQEIVTLLYLHFPQSIRRSELLTECEMIQESTKESKLDVTFHRLLRALLDSNLCETAFNILSNTIVHHKGLFLRYVPIMTALIEGRSHVTPTAFMEKQFYRLYMHCLGLLDLLRPQVFEYGEALHSLLACYFSLLSNWSNSHRPEFVPLIDKFVAFLCYYVLDYSEFVLKNVADFEKIFRKIRKKYKGEVNDSLLDRLLSLVGNPGRNKEMVEVALRFGSLDEVVIGEGRTCLVALVNRKEKWGNPLVQDASDGVMIGSTKELLVQDVLVVLEKLKETSEMVPVNVQHYLPEILMLLQCPYPRVRDLCHSLLLCFLSYSPSACAQIIPAYLACFSNSSMGVQADALQRASDFYFYANDLSASFMSELFSMGLAAAPVIKTIASHSAHF